MERTPFGASFLFCRRVGFLTYYVKFEVGE